MQNIWGARYIDDLVARRRDADADRDYSDAGDATTYALSDVQFSVVAMLSGGKVLERVAYDPYGAARHHRGKDDDGDVDAADKTAVTTIAGMTDKAIYETDYTSDADIDRNGVVDSSDTGYVNSAFASRLADGKISDPTSAGAGQ